MAATVYHFVSKEKENRIFGHNCIFRHTCMYKQTKLTKQRNYNIFVQILYSYLRYTDRLLDVFFSSLAVILSEFHEKPRKKDWVTEKKYIEEVVWGRSLSWLHTTFLCHFLSLFCLLPSLSPSVFSLVCIAFLLLIFFKTWETEALWIKCVSNSRYAYAITNIHYCFQSYSAEKPISLNFQVFYYVSQNKFNTLAFS